ncbi:SGNH/GDSL hydrolase family protein [Jatrophihabitans sp.]|uniref:SGNH/GDSL hydrolase family protein n=1 Tax=Jatrophihabitans sp. TaxID=1932789 RepID=UPI0030C68D99
MPFLLLVGLAVALPASAGATTTTHYYVALGDSLSQGYQPGLGNTKVGYVDDVYTALHKVDPSLKLEKLGCSGETTTTMIKGGICKYTQGSQLAAAKAFLTAHKAQVSYVTLDIGANDVDSCVPGGQVDITCVGKGLKAIGTNIETILNTVIKADGGKPRMAAMPYYDPFLAAYLTPGGQELATLSVSLINTLNNELRASFHAHHVRVAPVATAFQTHDFKDTVTLPGVGSVPRNVGLICQYTYMCTQQNIHANPAGYQFIADQFIPQLIPAKG